MAGLTSSSKAVALVAGVMLAMVALAESKCELLDHEPVGEQQVIEFPGGKMTFQASLALVSNNGNTRQFVALTSSGQAQYERQSKTKNVVEADFDCAKLEFTVLLHPANAVLTTIDYTATMPGKPCKSREIALDEHLQAQSLKGDYLDSSCFATPDAVSPELAIRYIKFEFN